MPYICVANSQNTFHTTIELHCNKSYILSCSVRTALAEVIGATYSYSYIRIRMYNLGDIHAGCIASYTDIDISKSFIEVY